MIRKLVAALAFWLLAAAPALAGNCNAYPFTFSNGTTSDATQVNSNFASILTCANSNLAHNGANSDITSLSALSTPLSIIQGGTGSGTAAGAVTNLGAASLSTPNTFTAGPQTMSGVAINDAFTTIASAATTNIGAAAANYLQVTGTTTITAFDTVQAGTLRTLEFAGSLTLTNNASIILPNGVNIVTLAGDVFTFRSEGAGVWRMMAPNRARQPTRCVILTTSAVTCSNGGSQANNGTYTTPIGAVRINVRQVGGGGGGAGGAGQGGTGGSTTFGTITAGGGGSRVGSPGTCTGGDVKITGGTAATFSGAAGQNAGPGGGTPFGSGGGGGVAGAGAGQNASANTGAGGGGGGGGTGVNEGGGHGGGYCETLITSLAASYSYAVGAGGNGGTGSTSSGAGGNGGTGIIIVEEYYW